MRLGWKWFLHPLILCSFSLLCIMFFAFGSCSGVKSMETKAIRAGVGLYEYDQYGNSSFRFFNLSDIKLKNDKENK